MDHFEDFLREAKHRDDVIRALQKLPSDARMLVVAENEEGTLSMSAFIGDGDERDALWMLEEAKDCVLGRCHHQHPQD